MIQFQQDFIDTYIVAMNSLFPNNPAMAHELNRLFTRKCLDMANNLPDQDDDFDRNGRSSAYQPCASTPPILFVLDANVGESYSPSSDQPFGLRRHFASSPDYQLFPPSPEQLMLSQSTDCQIRSQEDFSPAMSGSFCSSVGEDSRSSFHGLKNPTPSSPAPKMATSCAFCRNNGEQSRFYRSHELRDSSGKVTCPVLRNYVCPICSASGDKAHTLKYCPKNSIKDSCKMAPNIIMRNSAGRKKIVPGIKDRSRN